MKMEGNRDVTDSSFERAPLFPYARIALEWLNPRSDLDPRDWVPEVVQRAKSVGIDTLAFDFYHGGYSLFPGSVAPRDGHSGGVDVIGLLDETLHEEGMNFVLMNMGAHCNSYASDEYSSWHARDAEGRSMPGILSKFMCLNSPYGAYLLRDLRTLLSSYQVDGLYIEGLYGLHCSCEYCKREYREIAGDDLPVEVKPGEGCRSYRKFRAQVATDFIRRVRAVIEDVSPRTSFVPCPSWFEGSWADFRAWAEYSDAIALERMWGFERFIHPLFEIGLSLQVIRAEAKRPPVGTTWIAWGVDRDYSPSTPLHYRLNFGAIMLYGGTPQLHIQTHFEVDPSEMATVKEMFELEAELRPNLRDAKLVPYAALVVDYSDYEISEHLKGFYQAMVEHHVPFEVISSKDLAVESLRKFRSIVLPNITNLSDDAVSALGEFRQGGGGLVWSYRTGWNFAEGTRRETPALNSFVGVTGPHGVTTNPALFAEGIFVPEEEFQILPRTYYRLTMASPLDESAVGRLQSFMGSFAEVGPGSAEVWAEALDYDYSRMHRHHPVFGWYPGDASDPLILASRDGGRCVYFAGEFDRDAYKTGHAGLIRSLADSVVWASASPPPVTTDCAGTIEIATHFSPETSTYVIMLLNQATNQMAPGWIARTSQSAHDVRLRLRAQEPVEDVRSARGVDVHWTADDDGIDIVLSRLDDFDAVRVRCRC
jgi:hypothetical protein